MNTHNTTRVGVNNVTHVDRLKSLCSIRSDIKEKNQENVYFILPANMYFKLFLARFYVFVVYGEHELINMVYIKYLVYQDRLYQFFVLQTLYIRISELHKTKGKMNKIGKHINQLSAWKILGLFDFSLITCNVK